MQDISSTDSLSTVNNNGVSHILYEYIENSDKTISLYDYINTLKSTLTSKEIIQIQTNLINILLMLLCVLDVAQKDFQFTHYDLHLNNILLYKLDKITEYNITINGETFMIVLEYFPYIIDYGRSHIDYNIVKGKFAEIVDFENKKKYTDFKDFANNVCNKIFYIGNDTEMYLNKCINNMLNNTSFAKKLKTKGVNNKTQLLNKYYILVDNKITHNIDTIQYNPIFDTYKLIRSMCASILYIANDQRIDVWDYWEKLDAKIENSYPFYIPQFNHIYTSFDNKNKNTFEIISDIYKKIPKNNNKNVYKIQLGGGLKFKFKKIKKNIKLENLLNIYNTAFSKIKNKREYINKPDYSLVINRSVEYNIEQDKEIDN